MNKVNPFRVGTEIRDPENFIGRKDILRTVSIAMSNLQNISLHGERRTGKTSLLLYLSNPAFALGVGLPSTHIPVYFNFQGIAKSSVINVWQAITDAISDRIRERHPNGQTESERFQSTFKGPPELFVTELGRSLARLGNSGFNIHLLFDEFEQTAGNPDLGDSFYDALRGLPTRAGNISYIIATRTGLAELQPVYDKISSPFFNIFTSLTLYPFSRDDVRYLIFDYFARAELSFSLAEKLCAEISLLYDLTGYHPYFVQSLCYHLCERLDKPDWPLGQPLQEAIQDFQKDSDPHFRYFWKLSSKTEQEFMEKLATSQHIDWDKVKNVVTILQSRCLIVEAVSGWQLFSSVFAKWINEQKSWRPYVGRIEEIDEVRNRLNSIRLSKSVFHTILEWYGIPGIGKTTLSQNAIVRLCHETDIPFACIDFDSETNENSKNYSEDHLLVLEDIIKNIGIKKPVKFGESLAEYHKRDDKQPHEEEVIKEFLNYLNELMNNGPIVLIFDTTEKADSETFSWLEKNIIKPLCLTGRCIIIWTGRFPQRWRQFEIRRRVVSKKLALPSDATNEQVGFTDSRIYQLTHGYPLGNKKLSDFIDNFQNRGHKPGENELLNILDKVIDKYVMMGISPELNEACRVLAVVRQFDVTILRRILSRFVDYYMETGSFLCVMGDLTSTSLVEWDAERKGYALDETMRHILAHDLLLNQPDRYLAINEAAAAIYEEWIERLRENRSIYVLERLFHQAEIAKCKKLDQNEIAVMLKKEMKGYLKKYYLDKDTEFAYSATSRLYEELDKDGELKKVVGEQSFSGLKEAVARHLKYIITI